MDSIVYVAIFLLLIAFSLPALIFLIAFIAAKSRKKKQQKVLEEIGPTDYSAIVRYNKGETQGEFFKVKSFQGSGVLYVKDNTLYFEDTLHQNPATFDLKTCTILWQDINLVNGFLKWFSVEDQGQKYYFNIDSGMLIWNMDKSKQTTRGVFEKLLQLQDSI